MVSALYLSAILCGATAYACLLWERVGPRALVVVISSVALGSYGGVLLEPVLFANGSIGFGTAVKALLLSPVRAPASILGCLAGGLLAIAASSFATRVPLLTATDCAAIPLCIGQVVGRIGCLLNGCCLGRPTVCALGVRPPRGSAAAFLVGPVPLHPVQLYEAAAVAAVLLYLVSRRARIGDGFATGFVLVAYGSIRLALQFFRLDGPATLLDVGRVEVAALVVFLLGCSFLWTSRAGRQKT